MKGILIIGHGSRIKEGNLAFEELVNDFSKNSELKVYGAHMAHATPSIEDSVYEMIKDGITDIIILPYFLYGGKHIKENIPNRLKVIQEENPNITFTIESTLANDPLIIQALLNKAKKHF
ncbi:MAG: sirohydrochlorin ferrochelatase [Fusobacteriaceae bacterium]|jgi:sirohydrochlorin cobaltochelatase|nr:cobalamin [Fusobacteriales bacterium]MDN5303369.1 sirohydrochlorin ferrochelatase [Fusobacteriaceae bacterium]